MHFHCAFAFIHECTRDIDTENPLSVHPSHTLVLCQNG